VTRAAVLGAGSWGTAFSMVLADAGCERVVLCARQESTARVVNDMHENPAYLPGVRLPDRVTATADVAAAVTGAEQVFLAVPAQHLRACLAGWRTHLPARAVLVSLIKGVELTTYKRMSEVIREVARVADDRIAVITGPNLAGEIAARQPTASVVACLDEDVAGQVQNACRAPYFRPYTNADVVGCELGGAVKNVIALAVGMAAGMGLGDNARASLLTRGLAETARLGAALGADPHTFSGLAGLGDLVATCYSPLSRNRSFGERLGRAGGITAAVAATGRTAEGVQSARSILGLARRHAVDTPIVEHVAGVLAGAMTPSEMLRSLLSRAARSERVTP